MNPITSTKPYKTPSYTKSFYDRSNTHYYTEEFEKEQFPKPRTPHVESKRLNPLSLILIAVAALAAVLLFASVLVSIIGGGFAAASLPKDPAISTPVSEWKKGSVPALYQIDPTWKLDPYAGGTIEENGCGPTCLSMVYIALTGKTDYDPVRMSAFSEQNGFVDGGATSWSFMSSGANMLGLGSEELPAQIDAVKQVLDQGFPIICIMGPGDFTTTGHFIVLMGIDENGQILIRDPNSPDNTARSWDIETILGQCRNLWALSA